jgi:hypothetical protein
VTVDGLLKAHTHPEREAGRTVPETVLSEHLREQHGWYHAKLFPLSEAELNTRHSTEHEAMTIAYVKGQTWRFVAPAPSPFVGKIEEYGLGWVRIALDNGEEKTLYPDASWKNERVIPGLQYGDVFTTTQGLFGSKTVVWVVGTDRKLRSPEGVTITDYLSVERQYGPLTLRIRDGKTVS